MVLRVPYPLGFYTKWMDGRIDNPKGGLEGQGPVGHDQHARAVPHGNREGHDEQGLQVPGPAGSAGEVDAGLGARGSGLGTRRSRVRAPARAGLAWVPHTSSRWVREHYRCPSPEPRAPSPDSYSSLIQMLRKLIGWLGSPCDCSLIGAVSYAL